MVFCSIARPSPTDDRFGTCFVEAVYSCETKIFRTPGARGRGAEWYVVEAQVDGSRMTLWVKKSDKPSPDLLEMFESASKDHVAKQMAVALDTCAAAAAWPQVCSHSPCVVPSVSKACESVAGGPLKTLSLRCKVFEDEQEQAKSMLVVALRKRREQDEDAIEAVESGLSPLLVDDVQAVALLQKHLAAATKEREMVVREMKRVKVVHERLLKAFSDPIVVSETATCEVCWSECDKGQSMSCVKDGGGHSLCPLCVQNTMIASRSPDPANRLAVVACPLSLAGFSCGFELREVVPKLAACPDPPAAIAAAMRIESSHALLRSKMLVGKVEALCKGIVCECGFVFETFTAPGTCASVKCPQCLNYVCALCYQVAPGTGATQNTAAHMMSHICPYNLEHGKQFHSDEQKATMFKHRIMFQIVQELLPLNKKPALLAKAREALEENAEQLAAVAAPSLLLPDDIREILLNPYGTHIDNLPKSVRVEFRRLIEAAEEEQQWKPLSYSAESMAELSSAISHVDAGEIARSTCVQDSQTARAALRSLCCALRMVVGTPGADVSTTEIMDKFLEATIPHFDVLDSVAEELDHAQKAVLSTTLLQEMYDKQFPEWSWDVPSLAQVRAAPTPLVLRARIAHSPLQEKQSKLGHEMAQASALIAAHSSSAFTKLKDIYAEVKQEPESPRAEVVMRTVMRSLRTGTTTRLIEMQLDEFDAALSTEAA